MSRESTERVAWKCPECERTYRIPRSRSRPTRCTKCEGNQKRFDEESDIEFAAVPSAPVPRATHAVKETPADGGAASVANVLQTSTDDPASASVAPTRDQFDQMIEHLASINRTMKLFRRFLWAIGIVALLNVLLVGASLLYGMSMLGSLFSGSTDAGGDDIGQNLNLNDQRALNALPPEAQKLIEDYSAQLNEALREAQ